MCKNAAGRSLVLHDFAKLLAKGKGEDKETRRHRKDVRDSKRSAQEKTVKPRGHILMQQKKSSIQPPLYLKPYKVLEVKGSQVTATR